MQDCSIFNFSASSYFPTGSTTSAFSVADEVELSTASVVELELTSCEDDCSDEHAVKPVNIKLTIIADKIRFSLLTSSKLSVILSIISIQSNKVNSATTLCIMCSNIHAAF